MALYSQNIYFRLMASTILASGAMALMGRMTSIAYPLIQSHFESSMVSLQWTMNAPVLATSSLILIAGRLGDYWGKHVLFKTGLFFFRLEH